MTAGSKEPKKPWVKGADNQGCVGDRAEDLSTVRSTKLLCYTMLQISVFGGFPPIFIIMIGRKGDKTVLILPRFVPPSFFLPTNQNPI